MGELIVFLFLICFAFWMAQHPIIVISIFVLWALWLVLRKLDDTDYECSVHILGAICLFMVMLFFWNPIWCLIFLIVFFVGCAIWGRIYPVSETKKSYDLAKPIHKTQPSNPLHKQPNQFPSDDEIKNEVPPEMFKGLRYLSVSTNQTDNPFNRLKQVVSKSKN